MRINRSHVSGKIGDELEFGREGESSTSSFNPLLGSGYEETGFSRARKIRDLSPSRRIAEESAFLFPIWNVSCQNDLFPRITEFIIATGFQDAIRLKIHERIFL